MSFTIHVDDIQVTVTSLSEAAALIRELRVGKRVAAVEAKPLVSPEPERPAALAPAPAPTNGSIEPIDLALGNTAVRFLKVIRENPNGVQADTVMPTLGVTKAKAIGSRSGPINRLLTDLGFKPKAVYRNPRSATGRIWQPGKQLQNAISAIEQRLGAH
jgi:hypothetical protein